MLASELVQLDLNWRRAEDERFDAVYASLADGNEIREAIHLIQCGCGKTYILTDGGHRISAAIKLLEKTGQDLAIPIQMFISPVL